MATDTRAVRVDTRPDTRTKRSRVRYVPRVILYLFVGTCSVLFMGPFVWTVGSSLKDLSEVFVFPPVLWPKEMRFENYAEVFRRVPYANFMLNSAIVTLFALVGQTTSATVVGYGFARFRFPFRGVLFLLVLSTLMLPGEVTIIPKFLLFRELGWLDTLYPLIVPWWFGGGAFYIFLMRQFFRTIPRDFDEAAKIDGANSVQIFARVILPLCKPAVSTVAIFSFLAHWNEFLEPLIYLNSPEKFTLALGLRYFQTVPSEGQHTEHLLMAASLMMAAPCLILFFAAQQYFVRGIVMSGIKS